MTVRLRIGLLTVILLLTLSGPVPFLLRDSIADSSKIRDWKGFMEDYIDTDGDNERDDFKSYSIGRTERIIDFLTKVAVIYSLGITEMTLSSYPNETAFFGNIIEEDWTNSLVFIDITIIFMEEEDGDPGEYYEITEVTLYHSDRPEVDDDDDNGFFLKRFYTKFTLVLSIIFVVIILLINLTYLVWYFVQLKDEQDMTTCKLDLYGVQAVKKNQFIDSIVNLVNTGLGPVYQGKGYTLNVHKTHPFSNINKKDQENAHLAQYRILLSKGWNIGSKIGLVWEGNKKDKLRIKVTEHTRLYSVLIIILSTVFVIVAFGISLVFYWFWVLVIVTLCICFLLTFILVLIPLSIGLATGFTAASLAQRVLLSKEAKNTNKNDRIYIFNVLREFSEQEVKTYVQVEQDRFVPKLDVSWH